MSEKWLYLQMTLGMSIMKKHVQPQPMEKHCQVQNVSSGRGWGGPDVEFGMVCPAKTSMYSGCSHSNIHF